MDVTGLQAAAAGSLPILGNLLGADAARRAQDDANVANRDMARDNIRLQREFAQNGIRWKVEDAAAAGIHPLYAIGAQGASFSPVMSHQEADMSQANMYSTMGQDISRAIQATRTQDERKMAQLQIASLEADVQGKALDNQIRLATINKMSGSQVGPSMPSAIDNAVIPGQNPGFQVKAFQGTASQSGRPHQEAGAINDVAFARTSSGYVPVPSTDVTERIEDKFIPETMWAIRNQLMPNFSPNNQQLAPSRDLLPPGYDRWMWHHIDQEWKPIKKTGGWKFSPATGHRFSSY